MQPERLLNAKQLAAITGEDPQSIRRKARLGRIPSVKFGGSVLFRESEVLRERVVSGQSYRAQQPATDTGWRTRLLSLVEPTGRRRNTNAAASASPHSKKKARAS